MQITASGNLGASGAAVFADHSGADSSKIACILLAVIRITLVRG
jgi:hypothetical protein